jgi:hypothetical protein
MRFANAGPPHHDSFTPECALRLPTYGTNIRLACHLRAMSGLPALRTQPVDLVTAAAGGHRRIPRARAAVPSCRSTFVPIRACQVWGSWHPRHHCRGRGYG